MSSLALRAASDGCEIARYIKRHFRYAGADGDGAAGAGDQRVAIRRGFGAHVHADDAVGAGARFDNETRFHVVAHFLQHRAHDDIEPTADGERAYHAYGFHRIGLCEYAGKG